MFHVSCPTSPPLQRISTSSLLHSPSCSTITMASTQPSGAAGNDRGADKDLNTQMPKWQREKGTIILNKEPWPAHLKSQIWRMHLVLSVNWEATKKKYNNLPSGERSMVVHNILEKNIMPDHHEPQPMDVICILCFKNPKVSLDVCRIATTQKRDQAPAVSNIVSHFKNRANICEEHKDPAIVLKKKQQKKSDSPQSSGANSSSISASTTTMTGKTSAPALPKFFEKNTALE